MSFNLDDYVDVAERIRGFYERFPDGRLTCGTPPYVQHVDGGKSFVVYHARAYRTPDDPYPGDGWAWEPVPGPSQFTRDSELQNAETAAWGRAIVACGFATKKLASKQEVRNRQTADPGPEQAAAAQPAATGADVISGAQAKRLWAVAKESAVDEQALRGLVRDVAGVESLKQVPVAVYDRLVERVQALAVPFMPTIDGMGN